MIKHFGTVCAVVVTHNTGEAYRKRFEATIPQADHVIIVDNGSDEETLVLLDTLKEEQALKLTLIKNAENLGLAAAQNQGIRKAMAMEADWILLLDDDSIPAPDMVSQMAKSYRSSVIGHQQKSPEHRTPNTEHRPSLIAPHLHETNTEVTQRYVVPWLGVGFRRVTLTGPVLTDALCVIASGSLIKAEALRELGLMREDFFIDYVDTEFALRLKKAGHSILVVRDAILHHTLGEKTSHRFLWFNIITPNHSPERRYTIYRNRARMWRGYAFSIPSYICYDILAVWVDMFRIIVCEVYKAAKLKSALLGLLHGLSGKQDSPPKADQS